MGSARAAQSALVSRKRSFRLYRILYPETYCMNLNLYRCLILYVRRTITAASVLPISMGQWSMVEIKKMQKVLWVYIM